MIHLTVFAIMAVIALIGGVATFIKCKKDKFDYPLMSAVVAAVLAMLGMTLLAGALGAMFYLLKIIMPF